jgi:hypothetical protein
MATKQSADSRRRSAQSRARSNGKPANEHVASARRNGSGPLRPDYGTPQYQALKKAVEETNVTFHQVATAWFNWHFGGERCTTCDGFKRSPRCKHCNGRGTIPNAARARAYEEIFPELLRIFGEQRGGLITAYFCENIRVGAALTDIYVAADRADGPIRSLKDIEKDRKREAKLKGRAKAWRWFRNRFREQASNTAIHLEPTFGDPDSPRAKQLLFRCLKVHYQALEFLKPKPRKICMRMTFNVITMLLGTLDSRIGRGEQASAFDKSHDDQRALEEEIASTETYYLTSARRTARLEYILGMIPGLLLAGGVAALIYDLDWAPREMSIAFLAGSLGALVSVMQRLTADKLKPNHEAGKATLRILGGIRPFIGGLFGLALYVFVSGDLLVAVEPPVDQEAQRHFFAAIAFLAGFSERWAQDMIASGQNGTAGAAGGAAAMTRAREEALT